MTESLLVQLRTPQARVLQALMPIDLTEPPHEWPILRRGEMAVRAGYTAISGTITRVLNGIKAGSSSGDPHQGLLELGYIDIIKIDVDGISEVYYRINPVGASVYINYTAINRQLPPLKDRTACTNIRYQKGEE